MSRTAFDDVHPSEVRTLRYRCPDCKFVNRVSVLPHSPRLAKHHCIHCERLNEIETREEGAEFMESLCVEGKDMAATAKRTSFDIGKARRIEKQRQVERDLAIIERKLSGGKVKTPWGDATLLG